MIEPETRRLFAVDGLRWKIDSMLDTLNQELDRLDHEPECILRCFDMDCNHDHACPSPDHDDDSQE